MNQEEALKVLGLAAGATADDIKSAATQKKDDIQSKITSAPTEALKTKFQQLLDKIISAEQGLTQPAKSRSPLSETKMADLPGMAPVAADSSAQTLQPGSVLLNRYEIKQHIAQGGMGAVYRAHDKNRDEDIAIKVMLPQLMQNETARERFLNEARLSSQLSHPNIVNVYDVQQEKELCFLTMELLQGQDLRELMDNRKLARQHFSVEEVIEILSPICAALDHAHEVTIHRDIKPENIFLTEDGKYKLMDFGIARVMSTSQRTQTGAASGTAYYMAPEQLKGAKDIDGRADQYALAVLAYELLSGEVPAGAIEPLHELVKGINKKVSAAVQKALSPKPENRFDTLSEFLTELQGGGKGVAMPALPVKAMGIAASIVAAIVLLVVLGSSGALSNLSDLLPESEDVIQARYTKAVGLQGEVKTLSQRLDKERKQLENIRRDWQQEVRRLTSSLRTASKGKTELKKALSDAEAQTEHFKQVETLLDEVVFESTLYTQLQGTLSIAEQMLRDKQTQTAIDSLILAKETLRTMLSQAKSVEDMVRAGKVTRDVRRQWQSEAGKNNFSELPPSKQAEEDYTATRLSESEGRFEMARTGYEKLQQTYNSLINAGQALVKTKPRLNKARKTWLDYAKSKGLSDIPQSKQQQSEYSNYQQIIQKGELVAAAEQAETLTQSYKDLYQGAKDARGYRAKAKKAQNNWQTLAKKNGLKKIPQIKPLKAQYAQAEKDLKAGNLPGAGVAYKKLLTAYNQLEQKALGLLNLQNQAQKAQKTWLAFAEKHQLTHNKTSSLNAELKQAKQKTGKGQFTEASKFKSIKITYQTWLKNAKAVVPVALSAKQAKNNCEAQEKEINRSFCNTLQAGYITATNAWKKGEFNQVKTQFASLEQSYKKLFLENNKLQLSVQGINMAFRFIPAGSYQMGSNNGGSDEKPIHRVSIKAFKLMAKEVTFAQYDVYAKATGKKLPGDEGWGLGRGDRAVINVNWQDAKDFANWLSKQTGKRYRLPTEAEWEYACRSGGNDEKYCGGSNISSLGWYSNKGKRGSHPVGRKQPNGLGLYDMSGNVSEWTEDCWNGSYKGAPANGAAWLGGNCSERVLRGGSWFYTPGLLRSANRHGGIATSRFNHGGFRLAQD